MTGLVESMNATRGQGQGTLEATRIVSSESLNRLVAHSSTLKSVAMELTDAWGAAMFIMTPSLVENLFRTVGFSDAVASSVFESVRSLSYVSHKQKGLPEQSEFTWHGADVTALTLRGCKNPRSAMVNVTDDNVESFIVSNRPLFDKLMQVMPPYSRDLMFSPEVASTVLGIFGASVSPDKLYQLAWDYGEQVTLDNEGRQGSPPSSFEVSA